MKNKILYTKSVLKKTSKDDGIRICVMRRIKLEYKFDIWIPSLGPSAGLLKKYIVDKTMSWEHFSTAYRKQLLKKKQYLDVLDMLLQKSAVTILCVEKSAVRCHRFLLAQECAKRNSSIKIRHK